MRLLDNDAKKHLETVKKNPNRNRPMLHQGISASFGQSLQYNV